MTTIGYYLNKSKFTKGKYMARTPVLKTYDEKDFFNVLLKLAPDKSVNEIKDIIRLLIKGTEEILSEGSAISIPNFFRVAPSVRGLFESEDETFDPAKHSVSINFTLAGSYADSFTRGVRCEKILPPSIWPKLENIINNVSKDNSVKKDNANIIRGNRLKSKSMELAGMTIALTADLEKNVFIGINDIELINYSPKEITYNFSKTTALPEWLNDGTPVSIRLRYRTEKVSAENGSFIDSNFLNTLWRS